MLHNLFKNDRNSESGSFYFVKSEPCNYRLIGVDILKVDIFYSANTSLEVI